MRKRGKGEERERGRGRGEEEGRGKGGTGPVRGRGNFLHETEGERRPCASWEKELCVQLQPSVLILLMQIYHASEEYGIEDIRTSGGYFHLGKVFHELSRDDIAESMFDMVCHSYFSP